MKRYKPYKFEEKNKKDLNELIGEFKAKYGSFKLLKKDSDFKKLSDGDQEYVLDELKANGGFKEGRISIGPNQQAKLKQLVLKAMKKLNSKIPSGEVFAEVLDAINSGELQWNEDSDILWYIEYSIDD